jgi:hypothetical protein
MQLETMLLATMPTKVVVIAGCYCLLCRLRYRSKGDDPRESCSRIGGVERARKGFRQSSFINKSPKEPSTELYEKRLVSSMSYVHHYYLFHAR